MNALNTQPIKLLILSALLLSAVAGIAFAQESTASHGAPAMTAPPNPDNWIVQLLTKDSVAHAMIVLAMVAVLGLFIGAIKIFGVSIGIAGVLFSGLLFGHFQLTTNMEIIEFVREFGLILFVYSIGIQVGPGFLASLRREGLPMNLMAVAIVLFGALLTLLLAKVGGIDMAVAVGMFSGATTNTPSLAAAQSALQELPSYTEELSKLPGLGYAVAYPFGVAGIILAMLLARIIFRIDRRKEAELFEAMHAHATARIHRRSLEITNPNLDGITIEKLSELLPAGAILSRILHANQLRIATPETLVAQGDIILAVGSDDDLEKAQMLMGKKSEVDLMTFPSAITSKRFIVTNKKILGKYIDELGLPERHGVRITRVRRGDVEFTAAANTCLQFGDSIHAVGAEDALKAVESTFGNSAKKLNHPEIIPVFIGIILGVLLGSFPVHIPGIPSAVKLGLAGGPLVAAIVLSRIGRIGPLVWYIPASANLMMRELGIVLFLACVGLKSGDRFVPTLMQGDGFYWMALAAVITLVPLLIVGYIGRAVFKLNYMPLCGLLAGSMTDPPALAFACTANESDAPMIAYATVYPTTMIMRVLCAQLLVLLFM